MSELTALQGGVSRLIYRVEAGISSFLQDISISVRASRIARQLNDLGDRDLEDLGIARERIPFIAMEAAKGRDAREL